MTPGMPRVFLSGDFLDTRLATWIRREVDRAPPLTGEQIEKLRGLLPYPGVVDSSTAA